MITKEITIKGKPYKIKASTASAVYYEQMKGEMFSIDSLTDNLLYFYCMVLANNRDKEIPSFFDFLDEMDDDANNILSIFEALLADQKKKNEIFSHNENVNDDGKKKE